MYNEVITCCKLKEAKIYRDTLAKRFDWILTDSVALIGEHRADMLGRAGLKSTSIWTLFLLCSPGYSSVYNLTLCTFSSHAKT